MATGTDPRGYNVDAEDPTYDPRIQRDPSNPNDPRTWTPVNTFGQGQLDQRAQTFASGGDRRGTAAQIYGDPMAAPPPPAGPAVDPYAVPTGANAPTFHINPVGVAGANYGGVPGGANAGAGRMQDLGAVFGRQAQTGAEQAQSQANTFGQQAGTAFANQQQSRVSQGQALGDLRNYYQRGPGPSVAQAQLAQSSDAAMANNIAMSRSGRGSGQNADAARQAMFLNANQQQQLGQSAATLRAQESTDWRNQQLGAMGAYQQGVGAMRSGDLGAYGQSAGAQGQFAGLGQSYLGMGQQGQLGAETLGSQIQGQQLGVDQQTGIANATFGNTAAAANAGMDYNMWRAPQDYAMQKYGIDKGVQIANREADARDTAAAMSAVGGLISTGVSAYAKSDKREKTDIRSASFDLRPALGSSYEYTDPSSAGAAPGRHFGPMAQDLEKTEAGRSVVRTGRDGVKMVDTSRLSLVNTAAIAEMQRELERMKRRAG